MKKRAAAIFPVVERGKKIYVVGPKPGFQNKFAVFFQSMLRSAHTKKEASLNYFVFHNLLLTHTSTWASSYSFAQKHKYSKLVNKVAVVDRMVQKYALCYERWLHSLLNVFSYNHMASAMRSTLSEFCFCGRHWTSSNTACDNCVTPVSRALLVSLAGSASCWWIHRHSATRGAYEFFGRPHASEG